jgi:hypothetical protein
MHISLDLSSNCSLSLVALLLVDNFLQLIDKSQESVECFAG